MPMRPTADSLLLGGRLAELRQALRPKMSQVRLAELLTGLSSDSGKRFDQPTISHIEKGSAKIERDELELFLTAVKAGDEAAARVRELWEEAFGEDVDRAERSSGKVSEPTGTFAGLCKLASEIRLYDAVLIPGLLAVPAYTRKVVEMHRAFVEQVNVDHILAMRESWQKRLAEPGFGGMHVVITEGALRTGPAEVLIPQLQHVLDVTRPVEEDEAEFRAPVTLQVLPRHVVPPGQDSFVIFNSDHEPPVVFVDGDAQQVVYRGRIRADKDQIQKYTYTHNAAVALALPPGESRDLVNAVLEELSR